MTLLILSTKSSSNIFLTSAGLVTSLIFVENTGWAFLLADFDDLKPEFNSCKIIGGGK